MSLPEHPRLRVLDPIVAAIDAAASATARAARKTTRPRHHRIGQALQPGPATPLWNELAAECAGHLGKYGDQARLARELGLSRQRVHQLVVARTACPDAERTLRLLVWLAAQRPRRPSP